MIDQQALFIRRLIYLLLIIFILPLIIIFYFGQKPDVNNIKKPPLISIKNSSTLNLRGTIQEVKLSKDSKTAYIVASSRGVYIVDISNPSKPRLISQFKYFKNSYDKSREIELAKDRDILFVRDAQAGIYSIDITNLSEPKLLSSYNSQALIYSFCISKDEKSIYIADEEGIKIADIQNPDRIKIVAKYDIKRRYSDIVEVQKNALYLLSSYGIDIFDTSFTKDIRLVKNYPTIGDAKKIVLSKNRTRAYLPSGYSGVEIVDIQNKLHPKSLGVFNTSKMIQDVAISQDMQILYALSNNEIEIADIKNLDKAKLLRKIKFKKRSKIRDIVLSNNENRIFIADGVDGFKVINLQ